MSNWALPEGVLTWLAQHLKPTDVVVELGSGEGTPRIAAMCGQLYSVEHDRAFVGAHDGTRYIYAPIHDGWYHVDAIRESLPAHIDAVIVDGPPGTVGRSALREHQDLFGDAPMIIDDCQRRSEYDLAWDLARDRGASIQFHYLPHERWRGFAAIGWPS